LSKGNKSLNLTQEIGENVNLIFRGAYKQGSEERLRRGEPAEAKRRPISTFV